ncbi:Probable zinc-ribbon domain-containing protein [Singulisphaera sp. GP187]|uniref:zinc-ribbon domain-containing protein n=1 Tax=Singulisphaera sp. GP187 TaxID=1882752 RepID=UPI00092A101A|nr:zinc-ribbon domain-containing protein [Singulisphaera sp. GP187]SIO29957.1 Probable zinc-ribbon domain-containing protein [Singulisphaera sp. GP187]
MKTAVLVDPTALVSTDSYGSPDFIERGYYLDFPFTCVSCGSEEVWTATQQKWWYEVAKGALDSGAKHCRTCRRDARQQKGIAHPLQNIQNWFSLVRDDLGPALLTAGWHPVVGDGESRPTLLSYNRGDVLVRFRWDFSSLHSSRPAVILEYRAAIDAAFQTLVQIQCDLSNMTHGELQRRFDSLLADARYELGLGAKS